MREPAVLLSPMPVFYPGRNLHNVTRLHSLCRFSFFLIPAFSVYADKNLSTAFGCMMNMPVIPASRFKGDIADCECLSRFSKYIEIRLANKICSIRIIWLPQSKEPAMIFRRCRIGVYFFRHVESRPGIRPAGIKGNMSQNFCHFLLRHSVLPGSCQMILQRTVRDSFANECTDSDNASELEG